MLDVLRPVNNRLVRRRADELQNGDLVLVFDDDNLAGLYERIVEALETQRIIESKLLLEMWELTKHQALEEFDRDLSQLYEFLQSRGISVQQQSVANWIRGRTIGPQKVEDFRLMALASKNRFALANAVKMRFVVGKARGLRRLVGRKLGEMLRQAVISDSLKTDVAEMGLVVDDILAAVSLKRVASISQQQRIGAKESLL
jgi:hypothetical protein